MKVGEQASEEPIEEASKGMSENLRIV